MTTGVVWPWAPEAGRPTTSDVWRVSIDRTLGRQKGGTKAGPWICSCRDWIMEMLFPRLGTCWVGDIMQELQEPSTRQRAGTSGGVFAEP